MAMEKGGKKMQPQKQIITSILIFVLKKWSPITSISLQMLVPLHLV
jgi:hypothetical protein